MALCLGLSMVLSIMRRCHEYDNIINNARSYRDSNELQAFETALTKLCNYVLKFLCSADDVRSSNVLRRVTHAICVPEDICGFEETCLKLEHRVKTEASVNRDIKLELLHNSVLNAVPTILEISENTKAIRSEMDDDKRVKMLDWFSKAPVEDHHRVASKDRSDERQETCTWIFRKQEFQDWESAPSSGILWIHGIRKL